jgi:hypothetical protein
MIFFKNQNGPAFLGPFVNIIVNFRLPIHTILVLRSFGLYFNTPMSLTLQVPDFFFLLSLIVIVIVVINNFCSSFSADAANGATLYTIDVFVLVVVAVAVLLEGFEVAFAFL